MKNIVFRSIKDEIRILGVDDAPFEKFKDEKVALIGVVFRGGTYLEGVLKSEITVDGDDSTRQIIQMVENTRHKGHLRITMLSGITFGGLNIVDIKKLYKETGLPVIIVTRKLPDISAMEDAIENVENPGKKMDRLHAAGELHEIQTGEIKVVVQKIGISMEDVKDVIKLSTVRGMIPEPIRVAHIIASGITRGDSRGRA